MPKCPLSEYCPVHNFIHGAEAEEFRERLESLVESLESKDDEVVDADMVAADLREILRTVDARDSVAYLSAKNKLKKKVPRGKKISRKVARRRVEI